MSTASFIDANRRSRRRELGGPSSIQLGVAVDDFGAKDAAAGDRAFGDFQVVGVIRKGALRAAKVGCAHAGESLPGVDGRVVGGHMNDGRGDASEQFPEGFSFAEGDDPRAGEREFVGTEGNRESRGAGLAHGQRWFERNGVAMDEVEDAVTRGVQAGGEGRPGDGALRRSGRREAAKASLIAEVGEVRKIGPVALDEFGVHAVDAEDDDLPGCGVRPAASGEGHHRQQENVTQ